MKKIIKAMALLFALVFILAACSRGQGSGGASSSNNEITVILSAIGNNMDPIVANSTATSVLMYHVYDTLLSLDDSLSIIPAVAASWSIPDNLTYEFTIRDGYKFHNGDNMTIADVVYSIERLRNIPNVASIANKIQSVTADGNKVIVKIKEPDSSFIRDMVQIIVVNKKYCETAGDKYANEPIGSGPFKVEEYVPGDRVVLRAWQDYPFEKARIGKITFKGISEQVARYIALESGDANFADVAARDFPRAQDNKELTTLEKNTTNTGFVAMNTQKAPFNNANVRRAMAYTYNKEAFAKINLGRVPIDSMFPQMFSTYYSAPNTPTYDLEQARKLLAGEGYSASNPLKFEAWIYATSDPVLEAYQAELKKINVDMSITSLEFGVFLEKMMGGEYQMLSGSWNNTTGDDMSAMACYWSGSFGENNISFYTNKRCDELYDTVMKATDPAVIKAATREVQEIAANDMPMIPTFRSNVYYAWSNNLKGVEINTNAINSFRKAYLE